MSLPECDLRTDNLSGQVLDGALHITLRPEDGTTPILVTLDALGKRELIGPAGLRLPGFTNPASEGVRIERLSFIITEEGGVVLCAASVEDTNLLRRACNRPAGTDVDFMRTF